jgi:TP901-1 family phage major tail protein
MAVTPGQQIGRTLLIQIGDGADPEVFSNLCGLTTRSFDMSANDVDTTVTDCDDPAATPQKTGTPGIKSRTFTGSGKFIAGASSGAFVGYVTDAVTFNAKVIVPGLGTFTGAWYVTSFSFKGDVEGSMEFDATFMAGGVLDFVAE